MFQTTEGLVKFLTDQHVEFLDVRFVDLPGATHHFTVPAGAVGASELDDGLPFDGSSIRGFQAIHESDMLLLPDPTTAYVDPFRQHKTLNMTFFIHDPLTRESYSRDPRNIARKAEQYLAELVDDSGRDEVLAVTEVAVE